ncbi:hypothetical protein GXY_00005 [Novacetimonas hansenii ATCC 23769]|uniref:Uncharacterized protein n=1 Tax=Novacetimonas hansenii ATCC 23769 TaxID=714995 RepID=D5QA67_NOVHA|nr:hypothetical protein GXY_00005 [Novacetimonas hansenii ATCC 23769]
MRWGLVMIQACMIVVLGKEIGHLSGSRDAAPAFGVW